MRNYYRWAVLSLLALCVAAFVAYTRGLTVPLVLLGQIVFRPIYRALKQRGKFALLAPCLLIFMVALAALYYVADLALFPHSPRAGERLHDAFCGAVVSSLGGLFTAWGESYPGLPPLAEPESGHPRKA